MGLRFSRLVDAVEVCRHGFTDPKTVGSRQHPFVDGALLGCAKAGLVSLWVVLDIEARNRREERRARLSIRFAFAEHKNICDCKLRDSLSESSAGG